MVSYRSCMPALVECWERRMSFRLNDHIGHFDPVEEISPRLYPNDQPEARFRAVISYRRLDRGFAQGFAGPFTPHPGFHHSRPTEEV